MTLIIDSGFNYDPDASAYIDAVEAADQTDTPGIGAMETATRYAINDFVIGCKQDGIWNAIKVGCILAGAKTLEGSFIDLKSATKLLTNNGPFADGTYVGSNYTTGDYNRKTGLVGNGSTKYLDSNRAGNAQSQDNLHMSVYVSTNNAGFNAGVYMGNGGLNAGNSILFRTAANSVQGINRVNNRNAASDGFGANPPALGFFGSSRSVSASYDTRTGGATTNTVRSSETMQTDTFHVFGLNGTTNFRTNGRLAFYSIGESLNLALLDARVTALITAFGAAIP